MDPNTDGPQDLQDAIRLASEHLGVEYEGPDASTKPEVSRVPAGAWRAVLGATLGVVGLLAVVFLLERATPELDPVRVEADLRWAVAEVVQDVERLRGTLGRFPEPEELHGILSEAVLYEHDGGSYTVVGEREGVRVEYDGRVPLERWRTLELHRP